MVYKLEDITDDSVFMEIRIKDDKTVSFSTVFNDNWNNISLSKKDIYKLIGVLHLIQKEL